MAQIEISCPERLVPAIQACLIPEHHKRYVVLYGGRGSGKSNTANDIVLETINRGGKSLCAREFQKSISESVHSALKRRYARLGYEGFTNTDTKIKSSSGGETTYLGLGRNAQAVRSIDSIKLCFVDEAQFLSSTTLEEVLPSIRKTEYMEQPPTILMVANPQSSADPFSQRFIKPFETELLEHGFYEDDDHLIICINYDDNPWFEESGLEAERRRDEEMMPKAVYEHKWLGKYNDSVDNSIILAEWFDACIDAHDLLGFKPRGEIVVAHDPSDIGDDPKGLAHRHGSVVMHVDENPTGDVNDGSDWATDYAISVDADRYLFDGDGLGVGLRRQTKTALDGKRIAWEIFKGSESPDNPNAIYEPLEVDSALRKKSKTIKETFTNKRSQKYFELRDRVYRTYRAVKHRELTDPENLISFSSRIPKLQKLRSELCRLPRKDTGNGQFKMMTKIEMRRQTPPIESPNMADSLMMTFKERETQEAERVNLNIPLYGRR